MNQQERGKTVALLETLLMVAPLLLDVIGGIAGSQQQGAATEAENKREDQYNANSGQHINNFINDYLLQPIGVPGQPGLNDPSAFYAYDPNNPMAPMGAGGNYSQAAQNPELSNAFGNLAASLGIGSGGGVGGGGMDMNAPTFSAQGGAGGGQKPAGQQKTKPEDILGHAVNLLATSQPTEATFAAAQRGPQSQAQDPMAGIMQLLGAATPFSAPLALLSGGQQGMGQGLGGPMMGMLGGAGQGDPNALMQALFGGMGGGRA